MAWEQAGRQGLQQELAPSFQRAAGQLAVLRQMTTDFREPVIWVVLAIVARGVAEIVAFVLLATRTSSSTTEPRSAPSLSCLLIYGRLGQHVRSPDQDRVKGQTTMWAGSRPPSSRSASTCIWWYNNQIQVPNQHFAGNWAQEDELARAVEAIS